MTSSQLVETPAVARLLWGARLRSMLVECGGAPCRRFTISHRLLRRDGVRLNGTWYCGSACFTDALRRLWSSAPPSVRGGRPRSRRTAFHHLLLRQGIVEEQPLQHALRQADATGLPLAEVLAAEGLATELQIAAARAEAAGLPLCTALPDERPPSTRVPQGWITRYGLAPVRLSAATLLVGCTEEDAVTAARAILVVTGHPVRVCLLPPAMYARAAQVGGHGCEEMIVSGLEEGCARVLDRTIREGAELVHAAAGPDWLWVRLSGPRQSDLFLIRAAAAPHKTAAAP